VLILSALTPEISIAAIIPPHPHSPSAPSIIFTGPLGNNTPSWPFMPRQASKAHNPRVHHCEHGTSAICRKGFSTLSGLTRHINSAHTNPRNHLNTRAPAASGSSLPEPLFDFHNDQNPNEMDLEEDRHPAPHTQGRKEYHPTIDGKILCFTTLFHRPVPTRLISFLGTPCDKDGNDLPPNTPPPPYTSYTTSDTSDWTPFNDRVEFEMADFLYRRNQMPGVQIYSTSGLRLYRKMLANLLLLTTTMSMVPSMRFLVAENLGHHLV